MCCFSALISVEVGRRGVEKNGVPLEVTEAEVPECGHLRGDGFVRIQRLMQLRLVVFEPLLAFLGCGGEFAVLLTQLSIRMPGMM